MFGLAVYYYFFFLTNSIFKCQVRTRQCKVERHTPTVCILNLTTAFINEPHVHVHQHKLLLLSFNFDSIRIHMHYDLIHFASTTEMNSWHAQIEWIQAVFVLYVLFGHPIWRIQHLYDSNLSVPNFWATHTQKPQMRKYWLHVGFAFILVLTERQQQQQHVHQTQNTRPYVCTVQCTDIYLMHTSTHCLSFLRTHFAHM